MSNTATETKTFTVKEKIHFGSAPPELVPDGENPADIIHVTHQCEAIGYTTKRYTGNLNIFDMNLYRRTVREEILSDHPDATVIIEAE